VADLNRCFLVGRLTSDPALHRFEAKQVARFSIAVHRFGEGSETDFFQILAWDKLAETVAQYCRRGGRVLVDGRLQWRQWTDQRSGQPRLALRHHVP
jgi:single-strand DNA-binding protein